MTEAQRAQYLIENCSHGSATDFAKSIGTDKTRISKIVHGQLRLSGLFDAIIAAYPDVNPQWLRSGKGYPGDLSAELVRQRYEKIIAEKDSLIRTLQRIIDERL
ncbi:MAG: hypothetical protein PUK70_06010 [Bacteroidales bacterium]|nr:hypothetical protein [Bacteroidales bacterium]MDY6001375.1 hypothetical protein [Candidatus Cryptobacteroides sp.]